MAVKDREQEFLVPKASSQRGGTVISISEWLKGGDEYVSSSDDDRNLYWERLLRLKLSRTRGGALPDTDATVAALFYRLADQWRRETMASSSMTEILLNPAHLRIIGLGRQVVPLILVELTREPYHWFQALSAITGEDPAGDDTTLEGATSKWLAWASNHGFVPESQLA